MQIRMKYNSNTKYTLPFMFGLQLTRIQRLVCCGKMGLHQFERHGVKTES